MRYSSFLILWLGIGVGWTPSGQGETVTPQLGTYQEQIGSAVSKSKKAGASEIVASFLLQKFFNSGGASVWSITNVPQSASDIASSKPRVKVNAPSAAVTSLVPRWEIAQKLSTTTGTCVALPLSEVSTEANINCPSGAVQFDADATDMASIQKNPAIGESQRGYFLFTNLDKLSLSGIASLFSDATPPNLTSTYEALPIQFEGFIASSSAPDKAEYLKVKVGESMISIPLPPQEPTCMSFQVTRYPANSNTCTGTIISDGDTDTFTIGSTTQSSGVFTNLSCPLSTSSSFTAYVDGPGGRGLCSDYVVQSPPICSSFTVARSSPTSSTCVGTIMSSGSITNYTVNGLTQTTSSFNNLSCALNTSSTFSASITGPGGTASCPQASVGAAAPICSNFSVVRDSPTSSTCTGTITGSGSIQSYSVNNGTPQSSNIFNNLSCPLTSSASFSGSITGPGGTTPCPPAAVSSVPPPVCSSFAVTRSTTTPGTCIGTITAGNGGTITNYSINGATQNSNVFSNLSCPVDANSSFSATIIGPGGNAPCPASVSIEELPPPVCVVTLIQSKLYYNSKCGFEGQRAGASVALKAGSPAVTGNPRLVTYASLTTGIPSATWTVTSTTNPASAWQGTFNVQGLAPGLVEVELTGTNGRTGKCRGYNYGCWDTSFGGCENSRSQNQVGRNALAAAQNLGKTSLLNSNPVVFNDVNANTLCSWVGMTPHFTSQKASEGRTNFTTCEDNELMTWNNSALVNVGACKRTWIGCLLCNQP